MRKIAIVFGLIFFGILGGAMTAATAAADNGSAVEEAQTVGRTPPRVSFLDGEVSFWRPGAEDWTQAQINTALAPGDQLYIQGVGNLELQIGARAYVRGGKDAQIGLETQEPDFLRFKVTTGRVAFDLRSLAPGRTVEVDTPHGAFTMNHEGYYRLEVGDARTMFTTRRTGRASVAAGEGDAVPMESDESVVIDGPSQRALAFQAAPAMDAWDRWNYDRTDALLEASSSRYVAPDTYGAADLDRYGSWRVLPTYGRVWVPAGVAPGWAPYSTGSWMYDPYYGWTWVDTAPWGWAPYHYGRWVHVNSYWCWAPGPVVRRAVYAPALVAFFGAPGVSVGISIGGPGVGWVALGWGEPLIPWWGRPGFIHRPWWGGWGGPRRINNRVLHHGTVVTVRDIHHYHNTRIHNALIVVDKDRFGHGRIQRRHLKEAHLKHWRPAHRGPDIRPGAAGFAPSARHGRRPSEKILKRSTVTYGQRHPQRPVATKHKNNVRGRSIRSNREKRPDWDHGRAHDKEVPKKYVPRSHRPSGPDSKRPSAVTRPNNRHRNLESKPRKAPAVNRQPMSPRNRKPAIDKKSPRRPADASATRRSTHDDKRSRSVERPSHIQRPSQRRTAAPAPRPPAGQPKMNTGRRITNHPAASRPKIQRDRTRSRQPAASRPTPQVSHQRGDQGFRSSPRPAGHPQNQFNNRRGSRPDMSDRGQFRNNRSAGGRSDHRFQGRSRN
jgi:hypothetical protein